MNLAQRYKKAGGGCQVTKEMLYLLEKQYPLHVPVHLNTSPEEHEPYCEYSSEPICIVLALHRTIKQWKKAFKLLALTGISLETNIRFVVAHEYAHALQFMEILPNPDNLVESENIADTFAKEFLGLSYVKSRY